MKIQEVKDRLLEIKQLEHDDEVAHIYEDKLFYDFVESIKNEKYKTKNEIIEVAKEVLKVRDIAFSRWYA